MFGTFLQWGITFIFDEEGRPLIKAVQPDSPAARQSDLSESTFPLRVVAINGADAPEHDKAAMGRMVKEAGEILQLELSSMETPPSVPERSQLRNENVSANGSAALTSTDTQKFTVTISKEPNEKVGNRQF